MDAAKCRGKMRLDEMLGPVTKKVSSDPAVRKLQGNDDQTWRVIGERERTYLK